MMHILKIILDVVCILALASAVIIGIWVWAVDKECDKMDDMDSL